MKKKYSEQKALKKMGISEFSQITKENVGQFVSILPQMDPEVAKKALEQFPNFKELGAEVIANLRLCIENVVASNERSQQDVYQGYHMVLECLKAEMEKESISSEERREIEDKMIRVANLISEKDSENKKFLEKMGSMKVLVSAALIAVAGVVLGGDLKEGISNLLDKPFQE